MESFIQNNPNALSADSQTCDLSVLRWSPLQGVVKGTKARQKIGYGYDVGLGGTGRVSDF
jgi:hypothetical protein